jgi:hypothetical protein
MAAAADDHQIGLPVPSCRDDFFGEVTERWLGGDPRRAFRLCLSARVVKHGLGRREAGLARPPWISSKRANSSTALSIVTLAQPRNPPLR